jgi:hypothetical protein
VEISKILQRLDEAFYVARGIDARQRKLEGGRDGRRSPVFRLAGRSKATPAGIRSPSLKAACSRGGFSILHIVFCSVMC